ncbi:MAG: hypothetical protein PHE29_14985 [Tissierellia bacterium]|nr:hypothetical protein [Tissierellia bacterium]
MGNKVNKQKVELPANEIAPKKEENAGLVFDQLQFLERTDRLDSRINLLEKSTEFVRDTNRYILIVLFVGFLALLFSFISIIIQSFNSNSSTQIEFIKSVNKLDNTIEKINTDISNTKTNTP